MENNNSNQEHHWNRCPKGMLREVARRSSEQDRIEKGAGGQNHFDRRRLLQLAGAIVVTAGAGTIAYQSLFPQVEQIPFPRAHSKGYGGINCHTFLANMKAHIEKGLKDQELIASMDEHLRLCEPCQEKYDKMRTGQNISSAKSA